MTDDELAVELGIEPADVARLSPDAREAYVRLIVVACALNRGERPAGVMVDPPRRRRRS